MVILPIDDRADNAARCSPGYAISQSPEDRIVLTIFRDP